MVVVVVVVVVVGVGLRVGVGRNMERRVAAMAAFNASSPSRATHLLTHLRHALVVVFLAPHVRVGGRLGHSGGLVGLAGPSADLFSATFFGAR